MHTDETERRTHLLLLRFTKRRGHAPLPKCSPSLSSPGFLLLLSSQKGIVISPAAIKTVHNTGSSYNRTPTWLPILKSPERLLTSCLRAARHSVSWRSGLRSDSCLNSARVVE